MNLREHAGGLRTVRDGPGSLFKPLFEIADCSPCSGSEQPSRPSLDPWNRVTLPAMNSYSTLLEMTEALAPAVRLEPEIKIVDRAALRDGCLDRLTATAIFAQDTGLRDAARWVIRAAAAACGIHSASIQDLYAARGRGECTGFTVPAINIRGLTYDTARAVFRAARKDDVCPGCKLRDQPCALGQYDQDQYAAPGPQLATAARRANDHQQQDKREKFSLVQCCKHYPAHVERDGTRY